VTEIESLLQKTSRTFALTIPYLPEPIRDEVGIAYLLFRIIDTFEDAVLWPPSLRIEALQQFVGLLDRPPAEAQALTDSWTRKPPVEHQGYRELLARTPYVLAQVERLRPEARAVLRTHLARSAEGMAGFVRRIQPGGQLQLDTVDELRAYCYAVAGIVGEMLTELYLLACPALRAVAGDLRARAAEFGEGLQLVNILKDARPDAAEGRSFLPRLAPLAEVFALARRDLAAANTYVDLLRQGDADDGLVAFNAFICKLSTANLTILRDQGLGAKLTRMTVAKIAAEIAAGIGDRRPTRLGA
jgi:farnesyl-diphosphate farnesyltransferase